MKHMLSDVNLFSVVQYVYNDNDAYCIKIIPEIDKNINENENIISFSGCK